MRAENQRLTRELAKSAAVVEIVGKLQGLLEHISESTDTPPRRGNDERDIHRAACRRGADQPVLRAAWPGQAPNGQETLFDTWRLHAFFTTTDHDSANTVAADTTHRAHAIIEQVHADLQNSALAHLPSGKFAANAAWLVLAVIAFNLTRAAATITGPGLAKATTATIRRKLIAVPTRVASSTRRLTLHLPTDWSRETAWSHLFTRACGPPQAPTT